MPRIENDVPYDKESHSPGSNNALSRIALILAVIACGMAAVSFWTVMFHKPDIISTRTLEVISATGDAVVKINTDESGQGSIVILNRDNSPGIELGGGRISLNSYKESGIRGSQVSIKADHDGSIITLNNPSGRSGVRVSATPDAQMIDLGTADGYNLELSAQQQQSHVWASDNTASIYTAIGSKQDEGYVYVASPRPERLRLQLRSNANGTYMEQIDSDGLTTTLVSGSDVLVDSDTSLGDEDEEVQLSKLPSDELRKLTGNLSPPFRGPYGGSMYIELYNGSSWPVYKLIVSITANNAEGESVLDDRRYKVELRSPLEPLDATNNSQFVDFEIVRDWDWSWNIVEAEGIPESE